MPKFKTFSISVFGSVVGFEFMTLDEHFVGTMRATFVFSLFKSQILATFFSRLPPKETSFPQPGSMATVTGFGTTSAFLCNLFYDFVYPIFATFPFCLPPPETSFPQPGSLATVTGFGTTSADSDAPSSRLLTVDVNVLTNSECRAKNSIYAGKVSTI